MTQEELQVASNIIDVLIKVSSEINKLTQEVIKLNERLEDASNRGGKA
jgi:hypothetical protein